MWTLPPFYLFYSQNSRPPPHSSEIQLVGFHIHSPQNRWKWSTPPPLWMFLTSSLKCNLNLESDFSRPACFSCILTYTREKTKESDSNVNVEFIKANNCRSFWTITIFICLSNHKKQTFMFYLSWDYYCIQEENPLFVREGKPESINDS